MRTYLVRFTESKRLLGIFVAPSEERLWWYVDEATDVRDCDFVPHPPGGLYDPRPETPMVPTIADPSDFAKQPDWFRRAVISEYWENIFLSDQFDREWRPIVAANGHPS